MSEAAGTSPGTAPSPSTGTVARRHFWERDHPGGRPDGADLAALRRGVGRAPGEAPQMWHYYTTLSADGGISRRLWAEHVALTLYAIHQQSLSVPAHQAGTGFGTAALRLHDSDAFSPDAVDRRFNAVATATTLDEAAYHLRGLVRQFRQVAIAFDYTALWHDLITWQSPERIGEVRRRWGSQYFFRPRRGEAPGVAVNGEPGAS
ncbi:type I-E CRISPR-associated protein Cse2/CasB [Frankia sp. QA3]|uniref:type I-E CRISPR-associated protein Cse2/CasB n=1 Tax=Frankia sp. QA3 TaxID=710111 RepID=UPI000269BCF0|nr:type I-E CRISPR-associated protein Cse2/CasB [Frankia sp. QA3]EIV92933.1 CRISPR type I-E-associated protein CasB/Cse2 [Frankia sp. QA3]